MDELATHHADHRVFALTVSSPAADIPVEIAALDIGQAHKTQGTVLLLPGFTGSKEDFAPILPLIRDANLRGVAFDQPGQFESTGPDDAATYTVGWLGNVVCQLGKEFAADGPVHLVGHSFGGLVARSAVLTQPSLFASLTLLGSGPAKLPAGKRIDRLELLARLLEDGVELEAIYHMMEQLDPAAAQVLANSPKRRDFLRGRFSKNEPAALEGMVEILSKEPNRTAELAALKIPILVCYGADDDAWPPAIQADMAQRLGAAHVVIPDAAHSPALEAPQATVAALLNFWTSISPRGRRFSRSWQGS